MKKFLVIVLVIAVICGGVYFGPKLVHKCDACEELIFGTGYEANVLSDTLADDDQTICKACAEKHHAIEIALGKSLDDFKKKLFD